MSENYRHSKRGPNGQFTKKLIKDDFIAILKANEVEVHIGDDYPCITLKAQYLFDHKGKGSCRQTDENTILAWDINNEKFIKIKLSEIIAYEIV